MVLKQHVSSAWLAYTKLDMTLGGSNKPLRRLALFDLVFLVSTTINSSVQ